MDLNIVLKDLRARNRKVPIPPRLPTPGEIDEVEKELGKKLHSDLLQYLLKASDVVFGDKEQVVVANKKSRNYIVKICLDAWNSRGVPGSLLPICHDNADYYCICDSGEIVFWSHNDGEVLDEKWDSLAAWIQKVWIEESLDYI